MTRETPHKFPEAQVLMDLAVHRPFRTHHKDGGNNLHVCFDKKLKQNALNNFLLSHTPYRCSLGRPKEAFDPAKQRTKQTNKVRAQCTSSELSLPKIPVASESLIGRTFTYSPSQQTNKRWIDLESEEEEPCNFLSCKSVKGDQIVHKEVSSRPTINRRKENRHNRSRSLPLILKKGSCPSCLRTDDASGKSLSNAEQNEHNYSTKIESVLCNRENISSRDQEFTTVMEDGAKVTVYQRRLSIEVFMPRIS